MKNNINIDSIVDSFEFNTDNSETTELTPVIQRSELKEYLLQLRAMEGYQLAAFVDMLPENRTNIAMAGVISGGRNAQVKANDDAVIDFKSCPFHIRFTTEYGGQWLAGASEKNKRDMTRKFMDEPLKGTSLSQPRTALDYFYMTTVDNYLTPEVSEFICKHRWSKEEAKKTEGIPKPTYNIYLSYHNISANTDEQILNFHNKVRLDIAKACYNQMDTRPFELHIVGIVTGMALQESKQEGVSHAVHITVPAFLVYVRELECGKFSAHSMKDFRKKMKELRDLNGVPVEEIAQRFEVSVEDLPTLFQKYDRGFNMSDVIEVPTYGTKRTDSVTPVTPIKSVVDKPTVTKPVITTVKTVEEPLVNSIVETKVEKEEPGRRPSLSESMMARRNKAKDSTVPAETVTKTVDSIKPNEPVKAVKPETKPSALDALEEACTPSFVIAANGPVEVDPDGGENADELPEVKVGGLF